MAAVGLVASGHYGLMVLWHVDRLVEFIGHVGAGLAAYSPIAYLAFQFGETRLAIAGALLTVALASLPDVDLHVPRVAHRGLVHTVWFALVVGAGSAGAFALVDPGSVASPSAGAGAVVVRPDAFGFVVGVTAICSHLAVDALTPMGVAPLAPVVRRRFSLGLTRSADPVANRRLLLFGLATAALAAALGTAVAPSVG